METLPTYSSVAINPVNVNFLRSTTMAVLLSINPANKPLQASCAMSLSSQIYSWEVETGTTAIPSPTTSELNDFYSLYIKPIPVRRYKIKVRVRSLRKGVVH